MQQEKRNLWVALIAACLAIPSVHAFPTITNVVETGGDNEATDTITAKFTGQTFSNGIAGEFQNPFTVPVFGEDVPAYVDRTHQWNGATAALPIPEYLLGGEYIMVGNDNRDNADLQLEVTVIEPALVYVLVDNRRGDASGDDPPEFGTPIDQWTMQTWMFTEGFQPVLNGYNRLGDPFIPDEIGVDEGGDGTGPGAGINQYSSVYYKQVDAGTFTLYQSDTTGQNMYGVVVKRLPNSINNPPEITSISPTNNAVFVNAASGLSFTATTTAPNTLPATNISLTLNGQDVSQGLVITGTGTSRTVTFGNLVPNVSYTATIEVADQAGRSVSQEIRFDTFETTAPIIEAEDYNYDNGKFVTPPAPGAYAGLVGTAGVDYADGNTGVPAAEYRFSDFTTIAVSADVPRASFTGASAIDYQVSQVRAGDWMNYTRNFPQGRYNIYLRASSSAPQPVRLDLVTAGSTTANQTTAALGVFQVPATSGGFAYVPLTDVSGNPVSVALSGEQTLRLTGEAAANPNAVLNYLLFAPAGGAAQAPYLAAFSPGANVTDVPVGETITATVAGGSAAVDTGSIRLNFNGADVTSSATITPAGTGARLSFDPPGDLALGTTYPVRLTFSNNSGGTVTNEWSFSTPRYNRIITSAVDAGGDDDVGTPVQYTGQTFVHPNLGTITLPSFGEDVPAFRDRTHQWNGATPTLPIPDYLVGAEYIMTRNDNRDNFPYEINVTVSEPAVVYVLVDNRLSDGSGTTPPQDPSPLEEWVLMSWLGGEGFTPVQTGYNRTSNSSIPDEIGSDEGGDGVGPGAGINQYASIYSKEVPAGTFNLYQSDTPGQNMYGVVVKPLASAKFPPEVTLTAPVAGQSYPTVPTNITLTADATVRNSTISKVEFLDGNTVLGEDSSAPFSFNWSNVPPGRYNIRARATAANGESATSAPVLIGVGPIIGINFQDLTAETPVGYLPDVGDIFGDRANGQSYGWNDDNVQHARNRNNALAPDERYDTFTHMQKTDPLPAGTTWEIALTNGRYRVTAVAGEAANFDSVYDLQAEGTTFVSGTPTSETRFFEGSTIVDLTDGRLTISNGPTAANNKIAFLDIVPLGDAVPQPTIAQPSISGNNITITWTGGGTLQATTSLTAPNWQDVGSSGTHTEPARSGNKFFRVRL